MANHTTLLQAAQAHAQAARFPELLAVCSQITSTNPNNVSALLDVGALLTNFGFLTPARECFERARAIAPDDLRPVVNLANLARDSGDHAQSRALYAALLARLPNNPVIRRNAVVSLEYDPDASDPDRLNIARAWGDWAIAQAGGPRLRPFVQSASSRPLRIGYVSADLCQHTVGLFFKDILQSHDATQVTVFAYSAGQVTDWVTDAIAARCQLRDVSALDDTALASCIRQDAIDVLIDLSGHTAGSRLTVFAHRPAPVQVSWLGYFATTGLQYMDAVLLDDWHAPAGAQSQFVEPIIRLAAGRICYQPVPFAPPVAPAPCLINGFITFGSFNNTGKYNPRVFDVWAQVLASVPNSRLVLKWRTFNDAALGQSVTDAFTQRGIDPQRLDLRGPSFHADVLKEYADIDIALDPFPFTGGLTSCEALWMGVPVITWPQSRTVSRQTHAFVNAIALPELSAKDGADYVRIAVELAHHPERITSYRTTLRQRMSASPLMDVPAFARQLEACFKALHTQIFERQQAMATAPTQTILHVGPGHRQNGAKLPTAFQNNDWQEIRLDIDPTNEPDIIGSMLDMAAVQSESMDALYSAHNIEHVYAHEVAVVLKEFLRVLKPTGYLVITCPDLQTVCALVAQDKLTDAAYTAQAGIITPLDILYGHGAALTAGHLYMAHKCGFTLKTLTTALQTAGFKTIAGKRRERGLDLWLVASKEPIAEPELRALAGRVLPG
ncbi:O-linked N-acetylglucosamine transferase family protein [Rhodoferax antarcticus]|uniref:O-linked N-acetylglucosamine transferase family protein n=1 Tax=Rhodoferax antarcticus TaxID=81479 RepID=UPI0022249B17|nr:methyltransferase domain-containing protein [Rhodoferax antarcticus]MCW2314343.1 putative O-linked N-acetylglucosamine transferase (SPINDLY family) [Rhodoferax antarcticus]